MFNWFNKSVKYFFYDINATGLNQYHDHIIEYTFLDNESKDITKIINPYTIKINPLPDKIKVLTKITDQQLKESLSFSENLPELIEFIGNNTNDKYFISHNNDVFDKIFLKKKKKKCNYDIEYYNWKFIDTLLLSKKIIPNLKSYSLKNICLHFNLPFKSKHRTLHDSQMVSKLYNKLLEKISEKEKISMEELKNPEIVYNYLYN